MLVYRQCSQLALLVAEIHLHSSQDVDGSVCPVHWSAYYTSVTCLHLEHRAFDDGGMADAHAAHERISTGIGPLISRVQARPVCCATHVFA